MKKLNSLIKTYELSNNIFYKNQIFNPFITLYLNKQKLFPQFKLFHKYVLRYQHISEMYNNFLNGRIKELNNIKLLSNNIKSAYYLKEQEKLIKYKNQLETTGRIDFRNRFAKYYFNIFTYMFVGLGITKMNKIVPMFIHYNLWDNNLLELTGFCLADKDILKQQIKQLSNDNRIFTVKTIKFTDEDYKVFDKDDIPTMFEQFSKMSENTEKYLNMFN